MDAESLPPDLLELESSLHSRLAEPPPPELRGRVLGAVSAQLRSPTPGALPTKRSTGSAWAALAAAALIVALEPLAVLAQSGQVDAGTRSSAHVCEVEG